MITNRTCFKLEIKIDDFFSAAGIDRGMFGQWVILLLIEVFYYLKKMTSAPHKVRKITTFR